MARQMTIREIKADSRPKISVSYCNLQRVLSPFERDGYHMCVYGWDFDVYEFPEFVIITGYNRYTVGVHAGHEECSQIENAFAAWMQANPRASIDELQNTACQMLDTFARHILGI